MSHVFPRDLSAPKPTAARGDGVFLTDTTGKRYLDACGGAAVSCLGHSNQAVRDAITGQLETLSWAHTGFFTSEPAEHLADMLIERAPEGIARVYFVSGGSEATEAAIKLARQVAIERGMPERRHVVARWQSYHGNTLGALAASGNRWRRAPFEPMLSGAMHHVSPCHYWRWGDDGETEEAYASRLATELEAKFLELGPETVAAFIAEPVVGATMGAVPAAKSYFEKVRSVCDRHGVLLILDEVMCGMGRTGSLFACTQDNVRPDIVCIAKGLGAGMQPIGAMLCSGEIYEAVRNGSGGFQHGHTYIGHPTACAAGAAVLKELDERDLLSQVAERGAALMAGLEDRFAMHPHVGHIRGRGLFIGLEIVADRETKAAFEPELKLHARIKKHAFENGLMIYPGGGTIDGRQGDHILLAPPFIVEDSHLEMIVDGVAGAMEAALNEVASRSTAA